MLDDKLNSNTEEVVHPQNSNTEEVVHPQNELTPDDIKNMSAADFSSYLNSPETLADVPSNGDDESSTPEPEVNVDSTDGLGGDGTTGDDTKRPEQTDPFKVFNTEEEYTQAVNELVNTKIRKRLSKHREQARKYETLENMAAEYYPDAQNPIERLSQDLQEQAAEEEGIDVAEYKRRLQEKRDAQAYRRQQNDRAKRDEIINGWRRDADEIRFINPDFDLSVAMRDERFADTLRRGGSVLEAYSKIAPNTAAQQLTAPQGGIGNGNNAVNRSEIPTGSTQVATGTQQTAAAHDTKGASREVIAENGAAANASGSRATVNPATMSSADFKKYIEKCRNII